MKGLALAAALFVHLTAFAQDKGKSDISHNAEFRLRDTFEINESGSASVKPSHHNGIDERFKLGLGLRANEKFAANVTLLQSSALGQAITENPGQRGAVTGGDEKNFVAVNEAYATWMMATNLTMKFGRMNYAFGDGSVMSVNDYQAQPYAFDGVAAFFEFGFGRFQAFGFKYYDLAGAQGNNPMVGAVSGDPQGDGYGLEFEFKNLPQWLKLASLNVIQDIQDGATYLDTTMTNPPTTKNLNAVRYGVALALQFGWLDLKFDGQGVSGKESAVDSTGQIAATPEKTITAIMYQGEVGLSYSDFLQSRFFLAYHSDTGTTAADSVGHNNTYNPYFYEKHTGSGLMEIVGWGNLTDVSGGWTMHPSDYNEVGLDYHMFWKSQGEDKVSPGTYGQNLFNYQQSTTCSTSASCHQPIGQEIDLYAEHQFDGGLAMLARAGLFIPGDTLKDNAVNRGTSIAQFMLQGKMSF